MSERIDANLDFPELGKMESMANEFVQLQSQRKKGNEERMRTLKNDFLFLFSKLLIENPDFAKGIIETALGLWKGTQEWDEGDFRSEVFKNLILRRIEDGLYTPQDHEKSTHLDYESSLKFIEQRMRIVESLIENGFSEFEPYLQYLRDSRCKLKVRDMTFWIGTKHESQFVKNLGTRMNKDEFWNDLLLYLAQKTHLEIGGIDKVVGENRKNRTYPSDPSKNYDSIRSGNQIVNEAQKEAFKYDIYIASFMIVLERDLEIGSGQLMHHDRLGNFSRWRYTKEMCREAQETYMPTVKKHRHESAKRVRRVVETKGAEIIPEPDENFEQKIDAIMKLYPRYKYKDVEPELPEEGKIDDDANLCGQSDIEVYPYYNEEDYAEWKLRNSREYTLYEFLENSEAADLTPFEDNRHEWDRS